MNTHYTWKHLDRSESAETYATEKLDRAAKHLHSIISCDVTFESIHGEIHTNVKLHADGHHFHAVHHSKDIYACIDGLEDKIVAQVKKHHDKISQH